MEEAARLSEEKATQEEEKSQAQTTQGNNSDEQDAPFSMSELSKRMHCPINYKAALPFLYDNERKAKQTPEESLSHIPWRLRLANNDAPAAPRSQQNKPPQDTIMEEIPTFSSWTYLELRRHQNTAWASDRLKEGNELLFINPTRAETKFLEGLDLVPDHVDLLTAYAKLLITNNDLPAAESKLKQALEIDPNHALAQKTQHALIKVQQGRIRMQQQQQLLFEDATTGGNFMKNRNVQVAVGNSIYSDVLMERALMGDDDDNRREDDNSDSRSRKKSKKDRKRKKQKKKHKRKRKRRYYSSESDDDDSSSRSSRSGSSMDADGRGNDKDDTKRHDGPDDDQQGKTRDDSDSREDRRHRKDRKRRKKHRKRRRRRDHSSESDDGSRSSVSPENGEDDGQGDDVQKSKSDTGDNGADATSQKKSPKEERGDDSREDPRSQKDAKRRRQRDDRKHRSRKKSRRHDSS